MGKVKTKINKDSKLWLYGFVVFTIIAASFPILCESKFGYDEYFTINLVRTSWTDVVRLTALDVHPPLYYLAVKAAVVILGENFFAYHLVSLVCFLALVFLTERFVSRYFGEKEALFAVLALCSAPNMLRYALQVRMYSMAMLFVTASFYLIWILADNYRKGTDGKAVWKYWILLGASNVAAAYTHYFAGVAAVGLTLFGLVYLLAVKKDYKRTILQWCVCCVVMALVYLPWMFVMLKQMGSIDGNYWIDALSLEKIYGYLDMLFDMSKEWLEYGLTLAFLLGCFYLVTKKGKTIKDFWKWGAFVASGFFMVFGVGYSVLRTPILIDRYVVILVPMLWVAVVISLVEKREKWIEIALIILFGLCFMVNTKDLTNEYRSVENSEETQCLQNNMAQGDIMFHSDVQRLAERAAFVPELNHLVLEGADAGEAFHYWTDMIECEVVKDVAEVMSVAEQTPGISVWCETDTYVEEFRNAGWEIVEYPAWSVTYYRMYRP